jgi:hypothetical protein
MYERDRKEDILWQFRFGKITETESVQTKTLYFQGWKAVQTNL